MNPNYVCPSCGGEMRRWKRPFLQRLRFSAAYRCRNCGHLDGLSRLETLKVSRFARCPECHNANLKVLARRDYIDRYNRNPFRLVQHFVKARLYHCGLCRLQFYDLRSLETSRAKRRQQRCEDGGGGGS